MIETQGAKKRMEKEGKRRRKKERREEKKRKKERKEKKEEGKVVEGRPRLGGGHRRMPEVAGGGWSKPQRRSG